jgi:hypothetical protein
MGALEDEWALQREVTITRSRGSGGTQVTAESLTMMRCERCRAVLSNAEAPALIRAGTPCGVCGGQLVLAGTPGPEPTSDTLDTDGSRTL